MFQRDAELWPCFRSLQLPNAIDMSQLPLTHSELYQHFLNGNHVVSRAKKLSKFNCVSIDMTLEQSMNKDTMADGGITGYTQDGGRWYYWLYTRWRTVVLLVIHKMATLLKSGP